jgi:hypothetical protein
MFDAEREADRWTRLDCALAREPAQHDASFAGAPAHPDLLETLTSVP